jgi:vacuole morphology and inheritance protein 14
MSSGPEEAYFKVFMVNLLELFSTDRRLLETRGSLIIRQLCSNLSTEKIYRTFSEILEKEEDLEFASVMVQKLNIILITSPELAEFRRRLKTLETRVSASMWSLKWVLTVPGAARRPSTVHNLVPVLVS